MLAMASVLVFILTVSAQNPTNPQKSKVEKKQLTPQMRADMLDKEVGLGDSLKAKVVALFTRQDAKNKLREQQGEAQKPAEETKPKTDANGRRVNDLEKIIGTEKFEKMLQVRAEKKKQAENATKTPSVI